MITDTTSDALARIKNGYMAKREAIALPYSKLVLEICKLLLSEGYLSRVNEEKNQLVVNLKYDNRKSALTDIKRVSKPGLRVYKGKDSLPYVLNGLGIVIVSTPKGIMTDKQARKEGVGGEVMAYVW